jgi:hypothetical protein
LDPAIRDDELFYFYGLGMAPLLNEVLCALDFNKFFIFVSLFYNLSVPLDIGLFIIAGFYIILLLWLRLDPPFMGVCER